MVKYRCNKCGREFPNKTPHKCLTGFQKRHLTYTRVYEGKSLFEKIDSNTKSPWINVKEKLPYNTNFIHFGFTNRVLVRDKNGNLFVAYMIRNKDNEWIWYDIDDNFDLPEITHWMPIPDIPHEE